MIPVLGKLFAGGAAKLIESVGGVIDNLTTSKEEKETLKIEMERVLNSHLEKMTEEANKELELQLADVQNARDSNVKIQESANASWVSKNIAYIIDAVFVLAFVLMLVVILYKSVPEENKEIFYTAFGLLGGYVSTVINFHRGTSKGSEDKSKHLHDILSK